MERDASPESRDRGAALLLAIVVVTAVAVAITAALGFAATSSRAASEAYRPARTRLYGADAAAKIAARYLIDHPELATWNSGTCRSLDLGSLAGQAVTASVCPQTATSFELVREAQTGWAVITLPQSGDQDGVRLNSSAVVNFSGTVSSTGRINAGGSGTIAIANGAAISSENCRGTITVSGTTIDNATCVGTPLADPGYAIADGFIPSAGTGSCDTGTTIATLRPGTFTKDLWESTTNTCGYVIMMPGIYLFQDVEWSIDKKVIAGAPATTPVTTSLFSETTIGCDPTAQGVQIVLSGTTTIGLANGGSFHICGRAKDSDGNGTPDTGALQIGLYGPTSDQLALTTLTPTGASGSTGTWTTVTNGRLVDATGADASAKYADTSHLAQVTVPAKTTGPSGASGTAAIALTGFGTTGTTYATDGGSIALTSGVSATAGVTIAATVSSTAGGSCTASNLRPASASSLETVSGSLTCSGTLTAPLTATITATNTNGATRTWRVDGATVRLKGLGILKHAPPSNRNTLDQGGSGRHFWFSDVIYLPLGTASLQTPNTATYTSFDGLVVRTLAVNGTGGTNRKPIVGDPGYRKDGDVVVTVSVAGTPWVSGRWTYETADSRTLPPVPTTQSWVVHR